MSELGGQETRAHSVLRSEHQTEVGCEQSVSYCTVLNGRAAPFNAHTTSMPWQFRNCFPLSCCSPKGFRPLWRRPGASKTRENAAVFAAWQKAAQSPGQVERQGSARAPRFEAVFRVACLNLNSVFYCPDCHFHARRLRKRPCRAPTPANQRRRVACQEGSPTQAIPSRDAEPVF